MSEYVSRHASKNVSRHICMNYNEFINNYIYFLHLNISGGLEQVVVLCVKQYHTTRRMLNPV